MNELEEACRQRANDAGIDVRTSYFAGCLKRGLSPIHEMQDLTRLQPEQIEHVLTGFLSKLRLQRPQLPSVAGLQAVVEMARHPAGKDLLGHKYLSTTPPGPQAEDVD